MPVPAAAAHLTAEQIDALGAELDDIRARTVADLGERDRAYLDSVVRAQRGLEFAGRALLFAGFLPPAWVGGTTALALSKILDNMEIGHNVMHGQYDFLQDPAFQGTTFEWDTACPGDQWRHSHNYRHHTFTNVVGEDRDIGYAVIRIDEGKPWKPKDLGNPLYALLLATFFQYGVMLHDLEVENLAKGRISRDEVEDRARSMARKVGSQTMKDYVLWPVLTGPSAPFTLAGNAVANLARNLWSFTIIFCGHFPDGVETFTREEAADESRGGWYLRQLLGSANIEGGPLFHVMSGNLGYQVEHHLFPDMPSTRYAEIAPRVKDICERYGLPYNSGPFLQQWGMVQRTILRLAFPGGQVRPKPGPYHAVDGELDAAAKANATSRRDGEP
ncbi:MAG: fatty acid desaturase family protein, partial [Aquihabitans sp.]